MPVPILLMNRSLTHGGTERQITATALALDQKMFTPHVAYVEEGPRAEELRRAGVPLLQLPLNSYGNKTAWDSAVMLRRYIKERGIRLVHTFDHSISIFAVPASLMLPGVRVLSSQRYYFSLLSRNHRWMMHAVHRMARGIVVNAEAIRRHLVNEFGYEAGKIEVCYNGISVEQFSAAPRQRLEGMDFSILVGAVCVLRPEKNLGMLLEAFAQVSRGREDLGLLIVGSGPEREALGRQARELGIEKQCRFTPSVASVPGYLRGIDIFVHPSLSEGLPNAVMEAMACGCCVLSSDVGGGPEVIQDGKSGLLFEPRDLDTLISHLRATVEDEAMRRRLGQAAVERIRAQFTTERAARRMEEIYLGALS